MATFLLGHSSETDDVEREVVVIPNATVPTRAMIDGALPQFLGDIQQRPPAHSAIKIDGRRAYKLARKGPNSKWRQRTVTIHQIDVFRYEYPEIDLDDRMRQRHVHPCTRPRFGAALGTAAVMSAFERTAIGPFRVEDAVCPDKLDAESITKYRQPPLLAVADLPRVTLTDADLIEIRHGRSIAMSQSALSATEWAAVDSADQLVAILYEKHAGQLWPIHNFNP